MDSRRAFIVASAGVIALAIGARLVAATAEFWLDEIWSWKFASLDDYRAIAKEAHDNNHLLNTWIMHAIGDGAHWFWYRLPAVLAGVGTVIVCGLLAREFGRAAAVIALIVAGSSFLMIQYSSEARGYAYVMLCAALSVYCIRRVHSRGSVVAAIGLVLFAVLGYLAQQSYLFCYLACGALSAAELWRRRASWGKLPWLLALAYVPSALFLGAMCLLHTRKLVAGGGRPDGDWRRIVQFFSLAVGGPETGIGAWYVGGIAAAAIALGICLMARRDRSWLAFYAALFLSTIGLMLAFRLQLLYVRYFLVWMPFVVLALSVLIGDLLRASGWLHACGVLALVVIVVGNSAQTANLLVVGRGDFRGAIRYIRSHTSGPRVTLGSDNDLRARLVLSYYWPRDVAGPEESPNELVYLDRADWPSAGPEWVLSQGYDDETAAPAERSDPLGNRYRLVRESTHGGLSGCTLRVYHNVSAITPEDIFGSGAQ